MNNGISNLGNMMLMNELTQHEQNRLAIADLHDRADRVAESAHVKPQSFEEFKSELPAEHKTSTINGMIGAGLGVFVAANGLLIASMLVPSLTTMATATQAVVAIGTMAAGAVAGGALGRHAESDGAREKRQIASYEKYLDAFEKSPSRQRAYAIDTMPPLVEGEKVDRLRQQPAMALAK